MSTTTFQIISDLHIERDLKNGALPDWRNIITKVSEVLIIVGDVTRLEYKELYEEFMLSLCKGFNHVYLIPGNHEFYSSILLHELLINNLVNFCERISNLTLLNNGFVDLPGNIRLYGSTLWSYIPETNRINTLPILLHNERMCDSSWINKEYYKDVYNLETIIYDSIRDGKRLIVATHYAPTFFGTLTEKHLQSPIRFFYASDLDRLLKKHLVYTWIFGHTHVNCDYLTVFDTRVVSNQVRGYGFVKNKSIRIRHT
jgi:predicted phosphodiesterase